MQGLFVLRNEGEAFSRPKSKKEIRELLAEGDYTRIGVEATSVFGNEYDGLLHRAPIGTKIDFVGPDPYTSRKFYGRLTVTTKGVKLS